MDRISSISNPLVQFLYKLKKNRFSAEQKLFLLEGKHNIELAIEKGFVKTIFIRNEEQFVDFEDRVLIGQKVLDKLKSYTTNNDYIALCRYPQNIKFNEQIDSIYKRVVVLDNLQDPGNVGTIIRSAKALNYDAVILINNTVSWLNHKLVSATQGSIFTIPVYIYDDFKYLANNFKYYLFLIDFESVQLSQIKGITNDSISLVFGNEANGLNIKDYNKLDTENVFIEIDNIDSLNVASAAAIALYEFNTMKGK